MVFEVGEIGVYGVCIDVVYCVDLCVEICVFEVVWYEFVVGVV